MSNTDFNKQCNALRYQFPHLFMTSRPWAIGTDIAIRQFAKNTSENVIKVCIRLHTSSEEYLMTSMTNVQRITYDGRDAGLLSENEKEYAKSKYNALKNKGILRKQIRLPKKNTKQPISKQKKYGFPNDDYLKKIDLRLDIINKLPYYY